MGIIETIIAGITTAVLSSLILEWIREARKSGKQFLEKAVGYIVDFAKKIVNLIRNVL